MSDTASLLELELDEQTIDALMQDAYARLRALAAGQRRRLPAGETLSTTVLVHEAYLKVKRVGVRGEVDPDRFLGLCATAMRQILIDELRRRQRQGIKVTLATRDSGHSANLTDMLQIDDALDDLARKDERLVRVVECRFFAGYTAEETARALGVTERTVRRDWTKAQAYLARALG
ncbi:MAG: ECF-type sigma factor [Wenzhouxiangella sp.]|jgi:RNA polymerase sigma factor (TIGR02999 family)|nr:ECF-type sigma factor [Wenzhouxiangella sp.]